MPTPGMFLHGVTEILQDEAERLQPTALVAAEAAVGQLGAGALDCADALPGCRQYTAAVRTAVDRFTAFLTEAGQGVEAYGSIAAGTAVTYADQDLRAEQGMPAPSANGPRIGHA